MKQDLNNEIERVEEQEPECVEKQEPKRAPKHDKKSGKAYGKVLRVCGVAAAAVVIAAAGVLIRNGDLLKGGFLADSAKTVKESLKDGDVSYAEVAKKTQDSVESAFPDITVNSDDADSLRKDETVYVIMDADGAETERIVGEWLKNPEKLDSIEDESDLEDIKNTNGDETFKQDGSRLTWAAAGNESGRREGVCFGDRGEERRCRDTFRLQRERKRPRDFRWHGIRSHTSIHHGERSRAGQRQVQRCRGIHGARHE